MSLLLLHNSLSGAEGEKVSHLLEGTVTPGTVSFSFYINRTKHTSGGTAITVTPDENGYWYWDNENDYTITNLAGMFYNTQLLTSVKFGKGFKQIHFGTAKNMFSDDTSLAHIDVSNLNTSSVTNMYYMFRNCSSLTSLDVSNFDTSSVTDMENMFGNCISLTSLDVSNFDTSSVTSMASMFREMNLESLDLTNFDTSSVTSMAYMFSWTWDNKFVKYVKTGNKFDTRSVNNYTNFASPGATMTIDYYPSIWNSDIVSTFSSVNWHSLE